MSDDLVDEAYRNICTHLNIVPTSLNRDQRRATKVILGQLYAEGRRAGFKLGYDEGIAVANSDWP